MFVLFMNPGVFTEETGGYTINLTVIARDSQCFLIGWCVYWPAIGAVMRYHTIMTWAAAQGAHARWPTMVAPLKASKINPLVLD